MFRPLRLVSACVGIGLFCPIVAARPAAPAATPPKTVKVAAIQCSSNLGDIEGNRRKLTALIEEAARHGAKIIVLPEAAVTGYLAQDLETNWRLSGRPLETAFKGKDPLPYAEPVPGPSTRYFASLAGKLHVYLTVPLIEVEATPAGPRLYNTVCLMSPGGTMVAHYRKLHPWPYPEKSWATPGDRGVQIYDSEYGRMGLAICYDVHRILDEYRPLHLWALLYSIAWVDGKHPEEWFGQRLPEKVAAHHHYVIGANWSVDHPQPWEGYGYSEIISPDGTILASARTQYGSEIVYATIRTAGEAEPVTGS